MRRLLAVLALLARCLSMAASTTAVPASGIAKRFVKFTGAPVACSEGDAYYDLTAHSVWICNAANTWVAVATGSGAAWGAITGTLSSQTDLQSALNLKAPLASPTFTGHVTVEAVTATGATGTAKFVFDTGPTITSLIPTFTDVTTGNVSITAHGLAPKGDNNAAHYLDGTGAYSTPTGGSSAPFSDASALVASAGDATKRGLFNVSNATTSNTITIFLRGTAAAPIMDIGAAGRIAFGVTSSDVAFRKGSITVGGTPTADVISGDAGGAASINPGRLIVGSCITCVVDQFSSETSIVNTAESAYEPLRLGFARFFGTGQTSSKAVVSYLASGVLGVGTTNESDHDGWLVDGGECFVASDQTVSSTTLTSTTCAVTVTSGRKYAGVCELFLSDSVAADGAKMDFGGGSATSTNFLAQVTAFDSALNLSTQLASLTSTASATTFTGSGAFEVHFSFEPSSSGTLLTRFAQAGHTTGTLTLARGSHCTVKDTP